MGEPKRKFEESLKEAAVAAYLSGEKTAAQVAAAHGIAVGQVYQWKVQLEERAKGARLEELQGAGRSRADSELILRLEAERDEYQRALGEKTVVVELLKKRLNSTSSQQWSELSGLIETLELAGQKRKRGK